MDATQVLSQMNATWSSMLDKYYDHVAEEHLKDISEKFNIPLEDLQAKTNGLKEQIMEKLITKIDPINNEKTKVPKAKSSKAKKDEDKNELEKMGRKELQEMCKNRGIPTKRKNLDMINSIKEYDEKHKKEPEVEKKSEPEPEEQKEPEPEVEKESEEIQSVLKQCGLESDNESEIEVNHDYDDFQMNNMEEEEYIEDDYEL